MIKSGMRIKMGLLMEGRVSDTKTLKSEGGIVAR